MMIYSGDNMEFLATLPDNFADSIVTDPPYGLSFMGKKWDYDVPTVALWAECLRVLKPGGHLLAFAGTRTQHRMAVRIEDAGFEIRDMMAWVYGCLSEDSEVLTKDGWVRYHKAIHNEIMVYDVQNDLYQWEKPSRWNEYRVESDTAYRIQSDSTDQIVSRGHRCLVERNGALIFVSADELTSVEVMPTLCDNFLGLQEARAEVLQSGMQRSLQGPGLGHTCSQGAVSLDRIQPCQLFEEDDRRKKPSMEGRFNLLQTQREICESVDQICQVPATAHSDGPQGRLCNGTQAAGGIGDWQTTDSNRMRASCEPRRNGQPLGESDVVCNQCGPQALRARASYNTTVATVTRVEYTGLIWCPTVSTGAFVARRNGKVFITGNSGFPKSLDISKAIDKAAGAEREVISSATDRRGDGTVYGVGHSGALTSNDPVTAAAKWHGWGTALKPALEPITLARKPLTGTVAANVLQHGTGGLNIDGCRVGDEVLKAHVSGNTALMGGLKGARDGGGTVTPERTGRWPANLLHDGGDYFGEQSRFFYCAKASKADRNYGCDLLPDVSAADMVNREPDSDGMNSPRAGAGRTAGAKNNHPTVKPIELMRYLCRLVTPPGGIVLDPFTGSGSTAVGAALEGFIFFGAELDEGYHKIATARLDKAIQDSYIDTKSNKGA